MRKEFDTVGSKMIPDDAYYGINTARARENFPIPCLPNDPELLKNYLKIKEAAALANKAAGRWSDDKVPDAIVKACHDIADHFEDYEEEFRLPAIQGGAGTSTNLNVDEVIANRAIELLGGKKGDYKLVDPADDVNKAQSTNDTFPTAGHLTIIYYTNKLIAQLEEDIETLKGLSEKYHDALKVGRTQLEDAVPTTFGRSFHAYVSMFSRDVKRLKQAVNDLMVIPMGGTAIGTALNTNPEYLRQIVPQLSKVTGLPLKQADDLIDGIQNSDLFVEASSAYRALAVNLSKMSHDLRLLNSGPQSGFHEINLPRKQAGSSIMPHKVNPVIPEVCNQVCFQVIGHATTVTMCAERGQLELNAWEPVSFMDLFEDAKMLTAALKTLNDNALKGLTVNVERCQEMVEHSSQAATALSPAIGYVRVNELIQESFDTGKSIRELAVGKDLSAEEFDKLMSPSNFFVSKND